MAKNADGLSQLELVQYKFLITSVRSTNNIAPYTKHIRTCEFRNILLLNVLSWWLLMLSNLICICNHTALSVMDPFKPI